jgi:hypothetical protein
MSGDITGPPCFWGISIREPGPPGWGSLKNRDTKIWSWVPWDSGLKGAVLTMSDKNWKLQTRLLVREGAPHQHLRKCLKIIKERKEKNWSRVPDGCLTPRQTGRLTVGRNVTLNFECRVIFREPLNLQPPEQELSRVTIGLAGYCRFLFRPVVLVWAAYSADNSCELKLFSLIIK